MMRRFGFYISAALLTFSIGSLIAVKFYRYFYDNSALGSQTIFLTPRYKSTNFSKSPAESAESRFPKTFSCKNKEILPVWNEIASDKSFQDRKPIAEESADCEQMLEIKQIDLNQDDQKEIIVRGRNINFCSPVGNCEFWVFERKGNKYRKILYSTDYHSEISQQVKNIKTNGYYDIVLKGHLSASDTTYYLFKFDGKKYRENKCSVHAYVPGTSADPQWEFISCKEYYRRNKY